MTSRSDPDHGLRKIFHGKISRMHFQAIELGVVGRGVPDTNFCGDGAEGWIEFKATESYSVDMMPEQVGWILQRMRNGGRVFVVTRRCHFGGPMRGAPVDELWMHEGWDAAELRAEGLEACPPVLHLTGGPSRWDWAQVRSVLTDWQIGRR